MEVPGDLGQFKAELGQLLHRELEEGLVVGFEVDLAAHFQHLTVQLQEVAVGQAALGVALAGPGIAEVHVDPVHLTGGEELGQLIGVGVHEKDVGKTGIDTALHGHHHGVRHHFNGNEQHVRLRCGGALGEAALAAAKLHPQFPSLGHQLPPAALVLIGVPDQLGGAALHPGDQIFLFSHPHGKNPPKVTKFSPL